MKKLLLFLFVLFPSFCVFAQDEPTDNPEVSDAPDIINGVGDNVTLKDAVDMLEKVEAFVFLYKDETRNFTEVFERSDKVFSGFDQDQLKALDWEVANEGIATVDENDGVLKGIDFGETFLVVTVPKTITVKTTDTNGEVVNKTYEEGEVHYFAVFVSPTVTVLSPEGVIYKYQKMYNQPVRITFSHSKDFHINCVMVHGLTNGSDENGWYDATSDVARTSAGSNDDGYFEDTKQIVTNDLVFVISEEENLNPDHTDVVGDSGLNLQVRGNEITFVVDAPEDPKRYNDLTDALATNNLKATFTEVISNREVGSCEIIGNKVTLEDDTPNGIYFVDVTGDGNVINHRFKVVLYDISKL